MAVPAAATAALALGPILQGVMGGIASKPQAAGPAGRPDTSTAAIAVADPRNRRAAVANAREERLHALLTDPQIMGLLVTIGGVALATNAPFHHNKAVNAQLQALTAAAAVLMGLGRAGVGDLTTLTLAAGTAAVVSTDGLGQGLEDALNTTTSAGFTVGSRLSNALSWLNPFD